MITKRSQMFFR